MTLRCTAKRVVSACDGTTSAQTWALVPSSVFVVSQARLVHLLRLNGHGTVMERSQPRHSTAHAYLLEDVLDGDRSRRELGYRQHRIHGGHKARCHQDRVLGGHHLELPTSIGQHFAREAATANDDWVGRATNQPWQLKTTYRRPNSCRRVPMVITMILLCGDQRELPLIQRAETCNATH